MQSQPKSVFYFVLKMNNQTTPQGLEELYQKLVAVTTEQQKLSDELTKFVIKKATSKILERNLELSGERYPVKIESCDSCNCMWGNEPKNDRYQSRTCENGHCWGTITMPGTTKSYRVDLVPGADYEKMHPYKCVDWQEKDVMQIVLE